MPEHIADSDSDPVAVEKNTIGVKTILASDFLGGEEKTLTSKSGSAEPGFAADQPAGRGVEAKERIDIRKIVVPTSLNMVNILGSGDEFLRILERSLNCDIYVRGNEITVEGGPHEVSCGVAVLENMTAIVRTGQGLNAEAVERIVAMVQEENVNAAEVLTKNILSNRGKTIRPKTLNQKRYVDAIDDHTVIFGIGPAGTGKTYLAVAKAVQALQKKQINRIILTRPAIEAGEHLGFLPGTLSDKIDPYLRPLYDALHDMIDPASVPRLLTSGVIEIAPLAYMRGRTLNDAFIILDEAQNTSAEQMKMFLTRLGFGSKMVITGDITQVDLPNGQRCGLRDVTRILQEISDIAFCQLTNHDVVRHKLVGKIVAAYDRYEAGQEDRRSQVKANKR